MKCLFLPLLVAVLLPNLASAAKKADLKPTLMAGPKRGYVATFDSGGLEKPWAAAKGDWQVVGGNLVGKEKAEDKHAAVLNLGLPARDSAIRFSFKLDGATGTALSFNHAKGHLFRVLIGAEGITVSTDKDKKDENSKAVVLGKAAKLAPGEWHTILVELQGETVTVQTDSGAKVEGHHPSLNVEKTGFRFVTRGESLLIDDVTVWTPVP